MNEKHTTAKDFFIYLGALVALYVSVISLINLLFAIINSVFPDALYSFYSDESYTVRWTISSLIILFPLYIVLARMIAKDVAKHAFKKEFWIRKWSKYLTLFLTGGAIVGDLIVLINTFLGGEISIRFILKVVAVLLVAGFTFYYYARDSHKHPNALIVIASLIVLASIVGGFFSVGSPMQQRSMRFDDNRVSNLSNIQSAVIEHWQVHGSLPATLGEINDSLDMYENPLNDPRTGAPYEYRVTGADTFTLCATFETELEDSHSKSQYNWQHGVGRTCFDRKLDPALPRAIQFDIPAPVR